MRNKRKIKSKNGLYLFNLRNSTQLSANSKTFINSKQDKSCQIYSVSMAVIKDLSTNYMKTLKGWIKYNFTDDFFIDTENDMDTENDLKITTFCGFSLIYLMILWIWYPQVHCQSIRKLISILNVHYWMKHCIFLRQKYSP